MYQIDFVIPWVDGSDPKWLAEKRKYQEVADDASSMTDANGECRYRDNGLLKYWFRGVEAFTPWVNHVFFITCGQKPDWLNINHPKLICVNHKDYIPNEFLPTFNANTIEMNLHRIPGLSEHFVYFNDDIFFLRPISKEFFFHEGNPVLDTRIIYPPSNSVHNFERLLYNDFRALNDSFNPIKSVWDNRSKWFSISRLGVKRVLGNLTRFFLKRELPVTIFGHLALPHLKSTFNEVWKCHPELLTESSLHKFRSDAQVNQWLLCGWNQAKGLFYPAHYKNLGVLLKFSDENAKWISTLIETPSVSQICLNDTEDSSVSTYCIDIISRAFNILLPQKSLFEK